MPLPDGQKLAKRTRALLVPFNECYGDAVHAYAVVQLGERVSAREGRANSIVDTEGHAHRAYDGAADTLVLIQPDGSIGMIRQQGSAGLVKEYLGFERGRSGGGGRRGGIAIRRPTNAVDAPLAGAHALE